MYEIVNRKVTRETTEMRKRLKSRFRIRTDNIGDNISNIVKNGYVPSRSNRSNVAAAFNALRKCRLFNNYIGSRLSSDLLRDRFEDDD